MCYCHNNSRSVGVCSKSENKTKAKVSGKAAHESNDNLVDILMKRVVERFQTMDKIHFLSCVSCVTLKNKYQCNFCGKTS